MKGKIIALAAITLLALRANVNVRACTQAEMYDTVKDAVVNTYSERSYNFVFEGEDKEISLGDVEDVMEDITEDYSDLYEIDTKGIKECSDGELEGYEVTVDVSLLSYKEQKAFEKKLNKTLKNLKQKCKGKSKRQKVKIVNAWAKKHIAVKAKSKNNDFYTAFTTGVASREGYACVRAYLLCKLGVKTRVVKYYNSYYIMCKLGKYSYMY